LTLLAFVPPFICASINPTIFDTALGIAGGFGEAVLNGLVPIFFVGTARYTFKTKEGNKGALILLLILSLAVMGIEITNLMG
jgi:tyrosine-specific transport protein